MRLYRALLVGVIVLSLLGILVLGVKIATSAPFTRGVFRFSSSDWSRIASAGFNASTDGGSDMGPAQKAAGINGMQWLPAFDKGACAQSASWSDSSISSLIASNVSAGMNGITYQVSDEPLNSSCTIAQVVSTYQHITQVIHSADSAAKSFTVDDQFAGQTSPGVRMNGAVDILGLDVYPCYTWLADCQWNEIDNALAHIREAGVPNWQPVMQDFGTSSWRSPTEAELQIQFDRWTSSPPPGMSGYFVFAWDYTGAGIHENFWARVNRGATPFPTVPVSPSVTPSPSSSVTPSASPSLSPSSSPSPSTSPTAFPSASPTVSPSSTPFFKPPEVINGVFCVVAGRSGRCTGAFEPT
jgi:hypothetical protein